MEPLSSIDLSDLKIAVPVFLAVAMMPFTFNIAYGILFAVLGYTLSHVAAKETDKISKTMWILTGVFLIYLIFDIIL